MSLFGEIRSGVRKSLNWLVPKGKLGDKLFKLPPLNLLFEAGDAVERKSRAFVLQNALKAWIIASRNYTIHAGVETIPSNIRTKLTIHFRKDILDRVRYRSGKGALLSLQTLSFKYGKATAVTLDYVIIFRDFEDAEGSFKLWAHELVHVDQYSRWGIRKFAFRYLEDHRAVEKEADDFIKRYF